MIHFPFLEQHNVIACMSGLGDGDGATRDGCMTIFPEEADLKLVNQVHGITMAEASNCTSVTEADGIVIDGTSCSVGIRVADCVPIWILAPERRVGALVHAGREGTTQGIARVAVKHLTQNYGVAADGLVALIGPSAGPCCYEVSTEMSVEFEKMGGIRKNRHLDLWETNQKQLIRSGIDNAAVEIDGQCTICGGQFHSYRAHHTTSRNLCILRIL